MRKSEKFDAQFQLHTTYPDQSKWYQTDSYSMYFTAQVLRKKFFLWAQRTIFDSVLGSKTFGTSSNLFVSACST